MKKPKPESLPRDSAQDHAADVPKDEENPSWHKRRHGKMGNIRKADNVV